MSSSANLPTLSWVDLHSHSLISDGILTPEQVVERAAAAGVRVLALTDHDTVAGVERARAAAPDGLEVLPGIEISASHGAKDVHVLGYFAPAQLGMWDTFQATRKAARLDRFDEILDRLDTLGASVDREQVLAERAVDPNRVPGRPHVARALIAAGHVKTMQEAFERFLGNDAPAYVATRGLTVAEAIEQIHAAKGLAVVAHPIYGDLDQDLATFRDSGLDGVEAFHYSHDPEQRSHFAARAKDLGLLLSGGSDFHGQADDPAGELAHERLGQARLPVAAYEAFADALVSRTGYDPSLLGR
ncbi:MAG: PHP domain-containing protein [Planctomycetes bacterium]|nr:PHP domain-containing protein [Planctomycetota bacterium]